MKPNRLDRNSSIAEIAGRIKANDPSDPVALIGAFFAEPQNQQEIVTGLRDAAELNRMLADARKVDKDVLLRQISV
ncbi:MAG: hypothetical protein IPJ21_03120 [Sterolibacteriaceae bacterium]|nr:hypothetical protein [Sterolibacteriaceae bacterium]MBK9086648.1 hypothetical protein [Sterolibacteriaceae bacterium]